MGNGRVPAEGGWVEMGSRLGFVAIFVAAHLLFPISHLRGQDPRIRQQRQELDRIRVERSDLERQMRDLQNTAHDLDAELVNLDRRADATARIVRTLDRQLLAIADEVDAATSNMARAESELALKRVILRRRLVDIYKRGPLYTAEALLSAPSFGDLVARYKYLHLLALRDRALVRRV
jgi:septal ring factor EnvC (AmiA/AmiB activator)